MPNGLIAYMSSWQTKELEITYSKEGAARKNDEEVGKSYHEREEFGVRGEDHTLQGNSPTQRRSQRESLKIARGILKKVIFLIKRSIREHGLLLDLDKTEIMLIISKRIDKK